VASAQAADAIIKPIILGRTPETLYVSYSLHGGGAERLLTNIVLQQRDSRRISVVALRPGGVFRRTLEDAGISVTDLGMTKYHHVLRGVFQLAAIMRARRPEVVHAWDYFANLLALVALLIARLRPRLFWGAFGTGFGTQKLKLRFRATVRLNALLSSRVDGMIYNGVEARDYHLALGFHERRAVVINNSIDSEVFRHDPLLRDAVRAELGIGPDDVAVAVVARVDPMKDWPTVCASVRDLPGIVTLAVGKGTESLPAQHGLIGLGWRDDVVSVLSAADIFLLASAFGEGTSLAVGEAMLCGLPCIVTNVGDNGVIVGDSGIVVEPGNVAAIRRAIVELAADPERRGILGRLARARAAETSGNDGVSRLHHHSLAEAG